MLYFCYWDILLTDKHTHVFVLRMPVSQQAHMLRFSTHTDTGKKNIALLNKKWAKKDLENLASCKLFFIQKE